VRHDQLRTAFEELSKLKISKLVCKLVRIFSVVLVLIILRQGAVLLFDDGKFYSLARLLQKVPTANLRLQTFSHPLHCFWECVVPPGGGNGRQ
jgi:hypothetical protein